ncbi:ATP-binding cassette domain-containing protein, partial [Burkholderia multivorans]
MSFLTLQHVSKRYGDFTAIEQLDLSVERGEFLSLLGPSGCGKTTTLQMIAGFVAPSAGRVTLDGRDITYERPEKRGIGVVFQSYALFPH